MDAWMHTRPCEACEGVPSAPKVGDAVGAAGISADVGALVGGLVGTLVAATKANISTRFARCLRRAVVCAQELPDYG